MNLEDAILSAIRGENTHGQDTPVAVDDVGHLLTIAVASQTGTLSRVDGNTVTTYAVKQADINATSSGDTTVVAAVVGKKIQVTFVLLTCSAQVAVGWKSATTVLLNAMSFAQFGGRNQNYVPGWFVEAAENEALIINLSGNANVRGVINYIEVE